LALASRPRCFAISDKILKIAGEDNRLLKSPQPCRVAFLRGN